MERTAYSFTGPSQLRILERLVALRTVEELGTIAGLPSVITTGGATGWDMEVALAAVTRWPKARHVLVLPRASHDEQGVDRWLALVEMTGCDWLLEWGPDRDRGADAYRGRNELLVARCDVLVAGIRGVEFYRSGEWMTVNIAKRAGKIIHRVNLHHPLLTERSPL